MTIVVELYGDHHGYTGVVGDMKAMVDACARQQGGGRHYGLVESTIGIVPTVP